MVINKDPVVVATSCVVSTSSGMRYGIRIVELGSGGLEMLNKLLVRALCCELVG